MKQLIGCFILFASLTAFGKVSIGVDATYSLSNNVTSTSPSSSLSPSRSSINNSLSVVPYVGIFIGEIVEIDPFLGWSMNASTFKTGDSVTSSRTQHMILLGFRGLFHVVRGELLGLAIGPEFGYSQDFKPTTTGTSSSTATLSEYYSGTIWLGCPLAIDLHFTALLSARLSASLFQCTYDMYSYKYTNSTVSNSSNTFGLSFKTIFQPTFGFYFLF